MKSITDTLKTILDNIITTWDNIRLNKVNMESVDL